MQEIDQAKVESHFNKEAKSRMFKAPCSHTLTINVKGDYEKIEVYCLICNRAFELTREEVEKI